MALRDFESDELKILGDGFGGTEMQQRDTWQLGPWDRQGMAQVIEKAERTRVVYLDGNHEIGLDKKLAKPKTIFGIEFRQTSEHRDPGGRLFLEEHGDRYDLEVFKTPQNQARMYKIGSALYELGGEIDHFLQNTVGLEKTSVASTAKYYFKETLNKKMGILAAMERTIDASHYDGNVSGHSHIAGYHRTPGGKLLINDGSCDNHVEFAGHDRHGTWALFRHHSDHVRIELENGFKYRVFYKDHGLAHFSDEPRLVESMHTQKVDRLMRPAYQMWPARDCSRLYQRIEHTERVVGRLMEILEIRGHLNGSADLHWTLHNAQTRLAELQDRKDHASRYLNAQIPRAHTPAVRSCASQFAPA